MIEIAFLLMLIAFGFRHDVARMIASEARYCRSRGEAAWKLIGVPPKPGPYLVLPEPPIPLFTPGVDYGPATICMSRGHFQTISSTRGRI